MLLRDTKLTIQQDQGKYLQVHLKSKKHVRTVSHKLVDRARSY